MFCESCGSKIDDSAIFCSNCGHRVNRPNIPYDTPYAPYTNAPPTTIEISNKYVWALATVPTLVSWLIIEWLPYMPELASRVEELTDISTFVTIVAILLNCAFLSRDVKVLKNAGKNAENWLWMGICLVPLYLFVRSSRTDKSYAYAIVWCVMFLLDLVISIA